MAATRSNLKFTTGALRCSVQQGLAERCTPLRCTVRQRARNTTCTPLHTAPLECMPSLCRPYNVLHAWDYCQVAQGMDAGLGHLRTFKVGAGWRWGGSGGGGGHQGGCWVLTCACKVALNGAAAVRCPPASCRRQVPPPTQTALPCHMRPRLRSAPRRSVRRRWRRLLSWQTRRC